MKKLFSALSLVKKPVLFLCLFMGSTSIFSQRSPTHAYDFTDADFSELSDYFDDWDAGTPPSGVSRMDDEFFISRVRPLERITDGDYQVQSGVDRDRKMCLWVPLDEPTSTWKSLPRYCFEGDNFSLWSYIDIHGNWTSPWIRSSAGILDVAHKNGVKVGCVMSVPYAQYIRSGYTDDYSKVFDKLLEKDDDGNFVNSEKLVRIMKYYGIDGLGVNSEFYSTSTYMSTMRSFFAECHTKAKEIDWEFQLHWYDGTNDTGGISFDRGLGSHNDDQFGAAGSEVTDMLFLNYNWTDYILGTSVTNAEALGRSSYDIYAGFDIQGSALQNSNWSALDDNAISIGFWGAHSQSLIHQSATDNGTSDEAIQRAYLTKQELIFSGGNHNPALLPDLATDCSLSNSSLTSFHGLARYLSAKSTIQQVPFVTRFNLGNGLKFYDEGEVTFDHKWHNINTQDFMPTWRWWITDASDEVTAESLDGLIDVTFTWDDAYFGGSCLDISGATDYSRIKLFKTLLTVEPEYTLSLTYKLNNELDTHAKLFVALKDAVTTYKEIAVPAAEGYGEWTTFTTTLADLGIASGDEIAMIGIVVENTTSTYEMLVGELAVRNPSQTFAPVAPSIEEIEILRGYDNTVDYKMRYASAEESGTTKTYNDEVDTWYFEIYFQQTGQEVQLLTATTSWAAYVIDAPILSGYSGRTARFGVRAVAPDGTTKSDISWSDYYAIPYDSPSSEVLVTPAIIKPGDTFTVSLEDEMADAALAWSIIDPITDATIYSTTDATSFSTSIDDIGAYDLYIKDFEGTETTYRGKIQITPEETGAVPEVYTVTADKYEALTAEEVTLNYTSRDGEGTVSRAVTITDPNMLMVPAAVQEGTTYSYAVWVKVDEYAHDKQGTNLINKNTVADSWPHNNWGDLWVTIRPEWTGNKTHPANEVSFNTFGWESHDDPNEDMMSDGYSLNPGVWNHIVVTQEGTLQKMYFNGKKVAEATFADTSRREYSTDSRIDQTADANIFIGGGGVYKAGLNGWVDEFQIWNKALSDDEVVEAMQGYDADEVPEGLLGYYTFETMNDDGTFPNLGTLGSTYTACIVIESESGGEDTSDAYYTQQDAENDETGYPGITGSLVITTDHEWTVIGAQISSDADKTAVVTYATAGEYEASVTLTNAWGESTMTLDEPIVVTADPTGIASVSGDSGTIAIAPDSYAGGVSLRFAESGNYVVNVFGTNGARLQSTPVTAQAGGVASVAITAARGTYVVQVTKDGVTCKSVTIVKK